MRSGRSCASEPQTRIPPLSERSTHSRPSSDLRPQPARQGGAGRPDHQQRDRAAAHRIAVRPGGRGSGAAREGGAGRPGVQERQHAALRSQQKGHTKVVALLEAHKHGRASAAPSKHGLGRRGETEGEWVRCLLSMRKPQTSAKKSPIWALGQEFLKAYTRFPYMRACFGVPEGMILGPRFLI